MSNLPSVPQIRFQPIASLSTLEFWWQPPLNSGGAQILNYTLLCSSIPYSTVIGPSSFYAKVTPLVNSQDLTFQLAARNTNGLGPYIPFTIAQPGNLPSLPTDVATTQVNDSTVNLTWNFTQAVNESINRYFIISVVPSTQTSTLSSFQVAAYPNQRSLILNNMSTHTYSFIVQTVNAAAAGWCFPNASTVSYVGPSQAFNPSNLANQSLWLDGKDPLGNGVQPALNATISPWVDKSPRASVATLNGSVTYGGSTVGLNFNGGSYRFPDGTFSSGNAPISYFFVFNPSANNNNYLYGTPATGLQLRGSDIDYFSPGFDLTVMVPPTNQLAFVELNYHSTLRVRTLTYNTYSTAVTTGTPVYTFANTPQWIGSINGGYQFYGKLAEVVMFSRCLNQYERQVMVGQLAHKWNFTNYLSDSHPFKTIAPNSLSFVSPSVFYPTFVPGLKLWIDGSDPTGTGYPPANGAAITQWVDKSGIYNTLSMTGSPTYETNVANGKAAINFTGGQYGTTLIAPSTFITALDVFVVYKFTGAAPTYTYIFDRSAGPLGGGAGTMSNYNGDVTVGNNGRVATYVSQYNTNLSIMNSRLSQASQATSFYEQYSNGTLQNVVSGSPATGFAPYDASPNFSIGAARATTNFRGYICELAVFNVYLNTSQRQSIEGYLAWKWGLQGSLPGGHPYAAAAPIGIPNAGSQ
jgi:hypothetical protein